jgi:hypothetical protein
MRVRLECVPLSPKRKPARAADVAGPVAGKNETGFPAADDMLAGHDCRALRLLSIAFLIVAGKLAGGIRHPVISAHFQTS